MNPAVLQQAIVGCWLVFLAVWMAMAIATKRTVHREGGATELSHSLPILLGAWLLLKGSSAPAPLGDLVLPHTLPLLAVCLALTLAGLALSLWARIVLGRNWSSKVALKDGHVLVRRGPYALVRHPIYSALITMIAGSALATGTVGALLGVVSLLTGLVLKLRREEALMASRFPAEYSSYRSRVRSLIPGVL